MTIIEYAKEYLTQPKRVWITPDPELNSGRGFDSDLVLPITLDILFSASVPESSDITQIPIEGRADVTDHVSPKPARVEIEAGFSPYDNFWEQTLAGNALGFLSGQVQGVLGPIAGKGSAFALAEAQKDFLRSATPWERYKKLKKLKDFVVLCTVKILDQEYQSMILADINPRIDSSVGDGVRFTAAFQQVSFVNFKSERVRLKKADSNARKRKSQTENGVSPTKEASPDASQTINNSALKNFINSIFR